MDKVIVDCTTGERTTVPLTDAEVAAREAYVEPPDPVDRVAALEARLDAVAALAAKADATANEVAAAAKPQR